jgi:hypothetical protein
MKSLSERIADNTLKSSAGRNDRNRAAFILVRCDVSKAVDDGYSLLSIWETLRDEGRIRYTYQTFRRYARLLLPARPSRSQKWTSK